MARKKKNTNENYLKSIFLSTLLFLYLVQPSIPDVQSTFAHTYYQNLFTKFYDDLTIRPVYADAIDDAITGVQNTNNPTPTTTKQLFLTWSSNNNPDGTLYRIESSNAGLTCSPGSWSAFPELTQGSSTCPSGSCSLTHDNLNANICYCYRVSSKNGDGIYNPVTPSTNGQDYGCKYTLANIPIIDSVSMSRDASGNGIHTVSWKPNGNSVGGTKYNIVHATSPTSSLFSVNKTAENVVLHTINLVTPCNPNQDPYTCLEPNVKADYKVFGINNDGVATPSASNPTTKLWTPVNVPVDLIRSGQTAAGISTTPVASNRIVASWVPNANPEGTSYIPCRAQANSPDSDYKCFDPVTGGTTAISCNTLTKALLTSCKSVTTPGYIDDRADSVGTPYSYKVVAVNDACLIKTTDFTDDKQCFISSLSAATSTATTGKGWLLDYASDFDSIQGNKIFGANKYSALYTDSTSVNLKTGPGPYGNGALMLVDDSLCVKTNGVCVGIATFEIDASGDSGINNNVWKTFQKNSQGASYSWYSLSYGSLTKSAIKSNDNAPDAPAGSALFMTITLTRSAANPNPYVDFTRVTYDKQ